MPITALLFRLRAPYQTSKGVNQPMINQSDFTRHVIWRFECSECGYIAQTENDPAKGGLVMCGHCGVEQEILPETPWILELTNKTFFRNQYRDHISDPQYIWVCPNCEVCNAVNSPDNIIACEYCRVPIIVKEPTDAVECI